MIPVFEPEIAEDEIQAVVAALKKGEVSGSFGASIADFEEAFAGFIGLKHGIAVTSGTTALHLAVAALDLPPKSEILVSASTNVASALAVFHNGHVTVPIDSERSSWNLNIDLIDELVSPTTRAIIPVHLFGHPIDMPRVMAVADRHGLAVIEDCAESHGAKAHGKVTGSFGRMSCFSFYANKVITTGEGGMVITSDDALASQLRLLRNLAFEEPRFRHRFPGFNFRMTGYQAALGSAQLRKIERVIERKRHIAEMYDKHLAGVPGISTVTEPAWGRSVYWMYPILLTEDASISRDDLTARLLERGIQTRTFFCPMSDQPFLTGSELYRHAECPVAGDLWRNGLYLPSSHSLDEQTVASIAGELRALLG